MESSQPELPATTAINESPGLGGRGFSYHVAVMLTAFNSGLVAAWAAVGVGLVGVVVAMLQLRRKRRSTSHGSVRQIQKSGSASRNLQAGRDINITRDVQSDD